MSRKERKGAKIFTDAEGVETRALENVHSETYPPTHQIRKRLNF